MLEELFSKENIFVDIEGDDFQTVLKNVTNKLEKEDFVKQSFYENVLKREAEFPTGLEFPSYNIAIPHTDSIHVNKQAIVVIKPKNKVVFKDMATNSKDLDVKVILLLLISKNENQVTVLQNIIKKFANEELYNKLLLENSNEEIYNLISK